MKPNKMFRDAFPRSKQNKQQQKRDLKEAWERIPAKAKFGVGCLIAFMINKIAFTLVKSFSLPITWAYPVVNIIIFLFASIYYGNMLYTAFNKLISKKQKRSV